MVGTADKITRVDTALTELETLVAEELGYDHPLGKLLQAHQRGDIVLDERAMKAAGVFEFLSGRGKLVNAADALEALPPVKLPIRKVVLIAELRVLTNRHFAGFSDLRHELQGFIEKHSLSFLGPQDQGGPRAEYYNLREKSLNSNLSVIVGGINFLIYFSSDDRTLICAHIEEGNARISSQVEQPPRSTGTTLRHMVGVLLRESNPKNYKDTVLAMKNAVAGLNTEAVVLNIRTHLRNMGVDVASDHLPICRVISRNGSENGGFRAYSLTDLDPNRTMVHRPSSTLIFFDQNYDLVCLPLNPGETVVFYEDEFTPLRAG